MKVRRREFLKSIGSGLAVFSIFQYRFVFAAGMAGFPLSRSARAKLGLFADEIIPHSTFFASATEAGILNYIEGLLVNRFSTVSWIAKRTIWLPYYKKALRRLDEISFALARKNFGQISATDRREVLKIFAEDSAAEVGYRVVGLPDLKRISDRQLFETIRAHILQGYFADPLYGANKDYKGWESIGYVCHFNYPKPAPNCPSHEM